MIPAGFIQDLLARVDIADVVGRHVQLKKAGQNLLGLCPFHSEKSPSFTVSQSKQFFHCFGCGAHGSAIGFLMDHRGLSYVEAIHELAQQAGMTVPESARAARDDSVQQRGLIELLGKASDFYRQQLKGSAVAIDYLKSRGLAGQIAARYALGYSPEAWQGLREAFEPYEDARLVDAGLVIVGDEGKRYDRFRGRVMFPIRNRRGAVIGFGGRVIGSGEPKYLNSPETAIFHKGQELYGLHEAHEAIRQRRRVIVCEGYMDVIQLAQAGFGESVAALGTAVTSAHVNTLLRITDHVIFAFDGDAAGRKAARRALEATLPAIGDGKRASFVLLPQGEDPDSLIKAHGADAFEDEIARALPLSRWFLATLSEGRDLGQAEGRAAVMAEAGPLMQTMPPSALRLQLVGELATASRTSSDEVDRLFGLQPWKRLPASRERARGARPAQVESLHSRLLQALLAFPPLVREFQARLEAELDDAGPEGTVGQIVEVCRAADSSKAPTSGGLLEALADSPAIDAYRTLVARTLAAQADEAAARADVEGGLLRLELTRIELRCGVLAQALNAGGGGEQAVELRDLLKRQAELKRRVGETVST
ncbi:MAG TPA: DNA primase [Burkholderiaceae bacterium]|nr:DNA primase [Burkholderiaceae bacterium]